MWKVYEAYGRCGSVWVISGVCGVGKHVGGVGSVWVLWGVCGVGKHVAVWGVCMCVVW